MQVFKAKKVVGKVIVKCQRYMRDNENTYIKSDRQKGLEI